MPPRVRVADGPGSISPRGAGRRGRRRPGRWRRPAQRDGVGGGGGGRLSAQRDGVGGGGRGAGAGRLSALASAAGAAAVCRLSRLRRRRGRRSVGSADCLRGRWPTTSAPLAASARPDPARFDIKYTLRGQGPHPAWPVSPTPSLPRPQTRRGERPRAAPCGRPSASGRHDRRRGPPTRPIAARRPIAADRGRSRPIAAVCVHHVEIPRVWPRGASSQPADVGIGQGWEEPTTPRTPGRVAAAAQLP